MNSSPLMCFVLLPWEGKKYYPHFAERSEAEEAGHAQVTEEPLSGVRSKASSGELWCGGTVQICPFSASMDS